MASDSALVPAAERERFERDGYLIIRGALTPLAAPRPFRFEWHQDGGRQNREVETDPRPRMSVKLAYWLSDVSEPGRGNLKVVPGSHLTNWIPGPPRRDVIWPDPDGAVEVTAAPGVAAAARRPPARRRRPRVGPLPATTPLYGWLKGRDLLDPAYPPLRP